MQSFTQAQVAKKYNVSRATVNRWVDQAIAGKYNLQLDHSGKAIRILDNSHNEVELSMLSEAGIKYKTGSLKQVEVSKEFYELFSPEEITEIYTDLVYQNKINLKYAYKNIGAIHWDNFYKGGSSRIQKSVDRMLELSIDDIVYYLPERAKVNLADIGPGNGYPVKQLIKKLLTNDLISKYTCLDISKDINEITIKNISKWYPKLRVKSYEKDLEYGKIGNTLLESRNHSDSNLILHIGNTISNYDDITQVLKHLHFGMTPEDLLVLTFTLDTPQNRAILNYVKNNESDSHQGWLPKAMGIDIEKCEPVIEFNSEFNCKTKGFKLDKDYELIYNVAGKEELIQLNQGQIINTWKHYLIDIEKIINEIRSSRLELVELKTDQEGANALAICRVKV